MKLLKDLSDLSEQAKKEIRVHIEFLRNTDGAKSLEAEVSTLGKCLITVNGSVYVKDEK